MPFIYIGRILRPNNFSSQSKLHIRLRKLHESSHSVLVKRNEGCYTNTKTVLGHVSLTRGTLRSEDDDDSENDA